MISLTEKLLERIGPGAVIPSGSGSRVSYSFDFRRVEAIPRRYWDVEPYISEAISQLTKVMRTPCGSMELWKIQAAALAEIGFCKGAFLPIGVGGGKALISLLAPVILTAERPILFVPAKLRDQTLKEVIPKMSPHWFLHPDLKIFSYSALSLEKNATLLEDHKPDLIIFDEAHHVANSRSGRTRRLTRYFRAFPNTMCVAMSGTISKRSMRDWAHIIEWCLGDRAPVPKSWQELSDWADVLDATKDSDNVPSNPGALTRFMVSNDTNVRQGYRRRLVETPGVIASGENEIGTSLEISALEGTVVPAKIKNMIDKMRETWVTPNGDIIMRPVDLWRHIRELSLGFWYRWEVEPPREWLGARTEWRKHVQETLKHNRRGLDTELQVWNECKALWDKGSTYRGRDVPMWAAWRDIKESFKLKTVPQWEDDFALKSCKKWLKKGGICWTEHRAFGERLAASLRYGGSVGCDYFYHGAGDSTILTTEKESIIASIPAHGEGKNLQRYSRNLVTSPMAAGRTWEQLLGRTHRPGQKADTVTVDVMLHVPELRAAFKQARADAHYLEDMYQNRQKLNYANVVI